MNIRYHEEMKVFKLDTKNTSYLIGVVDEEQFVGHIYYGKKLEDYQVGYLMRTEEAPFVPSKKNRDRTSFYDCFPFEYTGNGVGDFRDSAISVKTKEGHSALTLTLKEYSIYEGKKELQGLPATFGGKEDCSTLELTLEDKVLKLQVVLSYTAYENLDAITRSVKVINGGNNPLFLTKVMSLCIDMDQDGYDMITMHGSWARERHIVRKELGLGKQGVGSVRGESSHQEHPFLALLDHKATQDAGNVYGFHFVYSGNFMAQVEVSQFDSLRVMMGIHPTDFSWNLKPGMEFQAPEVVMVYSSEGIGAMSRTYHDLYRNHLIRGSYKDKKRPILINNWEATYFDFNTEKLLGIAREASKLGIEMLVMDDGWFGNRFDDNRALGDWVVNEDKLQGGLNYLVDEVNKLGMKFGIWFEPEMISPDSDLYRAHPDWAIAIEGRTPSLCRGQYVLDLTRAEVVDYVFESLKKVLNSANIEYVKWDMNRQLTDIGGAFTTSDTIGEFYHRYMLGVYELQERLVTEFPQLLLENCSGGGARFDPGMLYYSPQIWCSDDTDAIERLAIQEGTAMIYPLSTMGAHVSDCPNHTVGRNTPFETRGHVALAGTFGYELDVTKIPAEDREMIPEQVAMYHKYNDLVRTGDYYRIASYQENHQYDCYQVVSKDKKECLITFVQVLNRPNYKNRKILVKGLNPDLVYHLEGTEHKLLGSTWMNAGLMVEKLWGDFRSRLLYLKVCE